jgi:DNA-directed RNA polymerase, mitochondrial
MIQRELSPAVGASVIPDEFASHLLQWQRELEDNSYAEGGRRFRKRLEKAIAAGRGSTVGAGLKILKEGLEPLEAAIGYWVDESKKTRGPKHCALKWVEMLGTDVAAYITLGAVLNSAETMVIGEGPDSVDLSKIARSISLCFLDELRFQRLEENAPGLFNYLKDHQRTQHYHQIRNTYEGALKLAKIGVTDLVMSDSHLALCGIKMIDLLLDSTGLVEMYSVRRSRSRASGGGFRTTILLRLTDDTRKWMSERNDALEFRQPLMMPMVVPPLDWGPDVPGGYRFVLRGKFDLVRGMRGMNAAAVRETSMPLVYQALNAVQRTAWRINPKVLALIEQIQRRGGDLCAIPGFDDMPIPAKPHDIATNKESRKAWRKIAARAHDLNHDRASKRKEVVAVTSAASTVKDADRIYFPFNLDFRGRIYPVATYLSPQGDDLSRALLTFADGKPLGPNGAAWLAIHLANLLDTTPDGDKISKFTLEERCSWVQRHTLQIQAVANDPFGDLWWTKADKPLQFYAACCEWDGFAQAFAKGEGDTYVSSLPIAMDGSCNGLQHFSAMWRDAKGGRAVNLVPTDAPQDVYQRVADRVNDALVSMASSDPMAAQILASGLVTRKLTKRPTMTFGYGSKKYGFREQLHEYLKGLDNWHELQGLFVDEKGEPNIRPVCGLLSELIMQALHDTVVAAFDGMAWMQSCAKMIVASGNAVSWTVPATGFPVVQPYYESQKKQIKTVINGAVVQPAIYTTTAKLMRHRQRNAVSPNVVHSLDAAALMLCVDAALKQGIVSFGMIHDSYATLAADTDTLMRCTRATFVELYSRFDVVQDLHAQFRSQCEDPTEMQNPPAMGDLDISDVLASTFFFS